LRRGTARRHYKGEKETKPRKGETEGISSSPPTRSATEDRQLEEKRTGETKSSNTTKKKSGGAKTPCPEEGRSSGSQRRGDKGIFEFRRKVAIKVTVSADKERRGAICYIVKETKRWNRDISSSTSGEGNIESIWSPKMAPTPSP